MGLSPATLRYIVARVDEILPLPGYADLEQALYPLKVQTKKELKEAHDLCDEFVKTANATVENMWKEFRKTHKNSAIGLQYKSPFHLARLGGIQVRSAKAESKIHEQFGEYRHAVNKMRDSTVDRIVAAVELGGNMEVVEKELAALQEAVRGLEPWNKSHTKSKA